MEELGSTEIVFSVIFILFSITEMKKSLTVTLCIAFLAGSQQSSSQSQHRKSVRAHHFNPTGLYTLAGKVMHKDGETYGYFGSIAVKEINPKRIVVGLFVCKGAPSYNSGGFNDTLTISGGRAVYKDPETDSSCRIILNFSKKGILVEETANDYNFGCGFGHAVIATGFYYKKSNRIPTDKELQE